MDLSIAFFDGWGGLARILVAAPLAYLTIVAFIRVSGKRTTSQMNSFDWIVTVALGSIVGAGIVQTSITLAESLLAIALLLACQWLLTWWVARSAGLSGLVKAEPRLLVQDGKFLERAMLAERVRRDEVMSAVRGSGLGSLEQVRWVVLETDASFSVIPRSEEAKEGDGLRGVKGFPPPE